MRKKNPRILIKPYKKKKKNRFKYVLMGFLFFGFLLSLSFYLWISWLVKREASEIEQIKKNNAYLRREIHKYLSSDRYYEEILRTKYGFIKEGEKIFVYSEPLFKKSMKKISGGRAL